MSIAQKNVLNLRGIVLKTRAQKTMKNTIITSLVIAASLAIGIAYITYISTACAHGVGVMTWHGLACFTR